MTNNKPEVLILPKWYPHRSNPFDGNFVENHAHAIKQIANVKVLFVHSDDQIDSGLYEYKEKDNQGILELKIYFKRSNSGIGLLDRFINFIRYRKAQQLGYERLYPNSAPDLCHVHVLARSSFLAIKLRKEQGIPFVITEHWSGYLPQSGALKASRKTPYYRRVANQAAAIHTVSQNLANAMKSHGIVNRFTVIPNVVDTRIFFYNGNEGNKSDISTPLRPFDRLKAAQAQDGALDVTDQKSEIGNAYKNAGGQDPRSQISRIGLISCS